MTLVATRTEPRVNTASAIQPQSTACSPTIVPALVTGALLWACHFPLAWGWLGWVALVPLLTLVRAEATPRRIYWSAYLSGLAFFVPAIQWMRVADPRMYATWMMLTFYCAAYVPTALWLIRLLDRRTRIPLTFSVPMVWIGLEWIRSFLLTGFAWYYLGHAQHAFLSIIQVADLGGVYAVSFLVAAVNGWLAEVAFSIPALSDRFRWRTRTLTHAGESTPDATGIWLRGGVVGCLVVAAVLYGFWRLEHAELVRGPRVAMLQTNVPQSVRNGEGAIEQMLLQNIALPFLALVQEPIPDLIVWPETSYIVETPQHKLLSHFVEISPKWPIDKVDADLLQSDYAIRTAFRNSIARAFPSNHLLGINTLAVEEDGRMKRHSSALLVGADGVPSHRFDKIHRVPFGEYVPLVDWLPFMKAFAPYGPENDYSIAPGKTLTRFPIRDFHFGSLVCYEDTDPILARQYLQDTTDGKPVDFLVNLSNDGWFHGTSEHEEHLVVSRFRAIENRRSLVRAVNLGISAVIDSSGRVLKPTVVKLDPPDPRQPTDNRRLAEARKEWDQRNLWNGVKLWEHKKPEEKLTVWEVFANNQGRYDEMPTSDYASMKANGGVLIADVPIDRRTSLYSQWGDWLPIGCWLVCLTALGLSLRGARLKRAS